ncbi:NAD-dependent epimerase/dehydratase family protein [Acidobacteriota bacterium]
MTCIVTGAAGFIGSHLSRRLLKEGFSVTGIDCFTDYYPRWIKEQNLESLKASPQFTLIESNINELDLRELFSGAEYVFHLAAQAGVRASWGESFTIYTHNNIEATQKILESAKNSRLKKIIFASSSSVYGSSPDLPWMEDSPKLPHSPYGVTKLAAEKLCSLYYRNYEIPAVSLRYFTVYGPGQRPDMAFHRFFKAVNEGEAIPVYGNGQQTRDFTYVDDIVEANISAMNEGLPGEIYNIGGGHRKKLADLFPLFKKITGKDIVISWQDNQKGDVPDTFANIEKAQRDLGYFPRTDIEVGLKKEWDWLKMLYTR